MESSESSALLCSALNVCLLCVCVLCSIEGHLLGSTHTHTHTE